MQRAAPPAAHRPALRLGSAVHLLVGDDANLSSELLEYIADLGDEWHVQGVADGNAAIVEALDTRTNRRAVIVIALQRNADESIQMVPLAQLLDGNPYDYLASPDPDSGGYLTPGGKVITQMQADHAENSPADSPTLDEIARILADEEWNADTGGRIDSYAWRLVKGSSVVYQGSTAGTSASQDGVTAGTYQLYVSATGPGGTRRLRRAGYRRRTGWPWPMRWPGCRPIRGPVSPCVWPTAGRIRKRPRPWGYRSGR